MSGLIDGSNLRGSHLYVWKKHGVFRNMVSRHYGPGGSVPLKPVFLELKLGEEDVAEIDFRFDALKPYLKPGPFA